MRAKIPADVAIVHYGGEIVLEAVGLTLERFNNIQAALPPEVAGRVIGWRKIGQSTKTNEKRTRCVECDRAQRQAT